jgi:predicted ATP-binding protein involved in virulence
LAGDVLSDNGSTLLRISGIKVKNLFGVFNHEILLKAKDRITIIYGPNGYGKTIVLSMIEALFSSKYGILQTIPFDDMEIQISDGRTLVLTKGPSEDVTSRNKEEELPYLRISLFSKNGKEIHNSPISMISDLQHRFPLGAIEDMIPGLRRRGPEQWAYIPTGEELSLAEIIDRFGERLPFIDKELIRLRSHEKWFDDIKNSINITFIRTERLRNLAPPTRNRREYQDSIQFVSAVTEYSRELGVLIQRNLAQYASLSQSRDRTFPFRLLESEIQPSTTVNKVKTKLGQLENKRKDLISTGLLGEEEKLDFSTLQKMDESDIKVISVYADDVEEKLHVFDELAKKIKLFLELINSKFLNKQVVIKGTEGFIIQTGSRMELSPAKLSSGEQHELVLLYDLLFKVQEGSLILIDEPELSLHVYWQRQFLDDLSKITELSNFDVLIATHSPDIIQDRDDLTVALKGPDDVEI